MQTAKNISRKENARPPVILHVINLFGAGVVTAVGTYIKSTEHCKHHILTNEIEFYIDDEAINNPSVTIDFNLGRNAIAAIFNLRKFYKKLDPDKVHLHSSYAGLYGRVAGIPSDKIIYTPHGFAFQRTDINFISQKFLYAVEKTLSFISRQSTIVACGVNEYTIASRLNKQSIYLPNYADIPDDVRWQQKQSGQKKVCMVGRVCNQKDPHFFIKTKSYIDTKKYDIQFIWIGDGDSDLKSALHENHITVTGWLKKHELLKLLTSCDLYFHTAAWDGLPMSLLEASKTMLPLVIRDTEAMSFLDGYSVKSPKDAANEIIDIILNNRNVEIINTLINNNSKKSRFNRTLENLYRSTN